MLQLKSLLPTSFSKLESSSTYILPILATYIIYVYNTEAKLTGFNLIYLYTNSRFIIENLHSKNRGN